MYFAVSVQNSTSTTSNFRDAWLHSGEGGGGEIDICTRGLFCTNLKFGQLLFTAIFDLLLIFGSVELTAI